ncbi:hypothetical protein XENTR_v10018878 [Xenopus tropicalis]|nr:hypothetical protein XENTR_v10018878 [Xenopus tropicalis]
MGTSGCYRAGEAITWKAASNQKTSAILVNSCGTHPHTI